MDVLFFCPIAQKADAERVLSILQDSPAQMAQVTLDVFDENSPMLSVGEKNYAAVVIVYTPEVELSGVLFEIVHYIDQKNPPGRFIFLPEAGGQKTIPTIFHLIRYKQHRLFFYPASGQSPHLPDAQIDPFETAWREFTAASPQEKPDGGKGRPKSAPFSLILMVSIFILLVAGLIAVMIPTVIPRVMLALPAPTPTPTLIRPPVATGFWLQESFQDIDTATRWQLQRYFYGQQAIQTALPGAGLRLSAVPVVTDAVYQLDSLQSWPVDELQSLSFSFTLSGLIDPKAISSLVFSLYLSEDNAYRLDCLIVPAAAVGDVQCQIKSPAQTDPVSETVPISLNTRHTVSLVFDPHTYTFQFFVDDIYYGQRDIQAVELWRTRNFNLQVMERIQAMNTGSFSCELEALGLAHQP